MNLLHDPWMPVRDETGVRHWITPEQLSDPRWRAFDADRPDFNGALAQFAIGLLQTTTPVDNPIEWRHGLNSPPSAETLRRWFEPVSAAFVFDGNGVRFMQDATLRAEAAKAASAADLLIDTPSEHRALFVKRAPGIKLCVACAAISTFTLQINSPEGGRGHFTGIRGGGPLTTLVRGSPDEGLWGSLWRNVALSRHRSANGPALMAQSVFPWLDAIEKIQTRGGAVTSAEAHELHVFWAMPRRLLLEFREADPPVGCEICRRPSRAYVDAFRSRPYGLNYPSDSWTHPLTPYRQLDGVWRPVRPKSDGLGYRHWLAWVMAFGESAEKRARVVELALTARTGRTSTALQLWCFGYEMRKDNPIAWHESTLPMYDLAECGASAREAVYAEVARWLGGAEMTAEYLRDAVFGARFRAELFRSPKQKSAVLEHLRLSIADFWDSTEPAFYRQLQCLIDATRQGSEPPPLPTREAWHRVLVGTALRLFDERFVGAGPIEQQNPRRAALARKQLLRNLHGPKLRAALGLPVNEAAPKPSRKSPARRPKENA